MITFRPFRAIRPCPKVAHAVASRPYDVLDSQEAKEEAAGNSNSFLRVIKPEIDLPDSTDLYSDEVYQKGRETFLEMIAKGTFITDSVPNFYVYRLTMDGRSQTGLVGCCNFEEYYEGKIKKHELTRTAKENDRVRHVETLEANAEPVFFSYRGQKEIDQIVNKVIDSIPPIYDFEADDGIRHELWVSDDASQNEQLSAHFQKLDALYVADGHHRTAAAARVGQRLKEANPHHTGQEEYNFFMAVLFPDDQLKIYDYNRVVQDLNGLDEEKFLEKLSHQFDIQKDDFSKIKPSKIREFAMYLPGQWYRLTPKDAKRSADPVADLDVTILSDLILEPILNIGDLRKSNRIDFVGGIRGLSELSRRVDSGEMATAFALYPVSMDQLLSIADAGEIMPPKTTWFEPKLRSGLFVHSLTL
ncbi:MAG: DUF1015 domain-containing protein [Opitutae bacterium]|nr:DUF1015 domain-containing protein [Opitutae bacterium]